VAVWLVFMHHVTSGPVRKTAATFGLNEFFRKKLKLASLHSQALDLQRERDRLQGSIRRVVLLDAMKGLNSAEESSFT
jgi:hypothetical protein